MLCNFSQRVDQDSQCGCSVVVFVIIFLFHYECKISGTNFGQQALCLLLLIFVVTLRPLIGCNCGKRLFSFQLALPNPNELTIEIQKVASEVSQVYSTQWLQHSKPWQHYKLTNQSRALGGLQCRIGHQPSTTNQAMKPGREMRIFFSRAPC